MLIKISEMIDALYDGEERYEYPTLQELLLMTQDTRSDAQKMIASEKRPYQFVTKKHRFRMQKTND